MFYHFCLILVCWLKKFVNLNQNAFVLGNKPLLGLFLGDPLVYTDTASLALTALHTATRASQDNVEVHSVNT